jgi:restriction system protein
MHTATILQLLFASWPGFASLLVLSALVRFLAPVFLKDHLGGMRVLSALRGLDTATYRHFQDLHLPNPAGRGTTRIEQVVVSPFGIIVIGTTRRHAWILDAEQQWPWVRRILHHRNRFHDPLLQHRIKVDALARFLNLPDPPFLPLVVFTRDCVFRTPRPGAVPAHDLVHWIRSHKVTLLDPSMVRRAVSRLAEHQDSLNLKATEKPQLHSLHVRPAA